VTRGARRRTASMQSTRTTDRRGARAGQVA
jgi:hypothetical protein